MRDLKMRGMLSTDLYVKVLEMSRATERPAVAYGFSLFMASLLCSAFLGCNAPSGEQASANQFRPADDAPAKKKEVPPKEAAPIAPKETAKDNAEPAANSPLESPNSKNSAKGAKEITGPFAGKLMELRKYAKFQPRGTTQEQQVESLLKATHARLALANELAGDPAAPDEVRDEALFTSMQCYAMLMNVNEPDARENFAAVAKEIAGSKNPNLAASGKVQLFQLKFMDILALKPQDGKQLIASLTNFLESIGEHGAGLSAAVEVVQALEEMGMHSDAAQAMQLLVTHYENNPNPQLVVQVQGLQVSMLLNQLRHAEGEHELSDG